MAAAATAVLAGHTDVPSTKLVILADDDDTLPDQASIDWTKAASEHLQADALIFTFADSPAAATTKASFVVASTKHNMHSSDELLRYACMNSHNFGKRSIDFVTVFASIYVVVPKSIYITVYLASVHVTLTTCYLNCSSALHVSRPLLTLLYRVYTDMNPHYEHTLHIAIDSHQAHRK
jgi:hypothetical protein